ncbi:MAG: hypothetical protein HYW45_03500 [Candidatus Daviesbacteria bacterium]|nr:MAG: hypothetical protein HYW45_03500 [Candidatus Daviesbacteria bacterium]
MDFDLNKRQKIILSSLILTIGLISTQLVDFSLRFIFLILLGIFSYILSLWALWDGLNKMKALVLLILPTFYTLAVASFYFLLPIRWLTRLPVALFFGLSFYLLLLSENVFNVASIRTIPLYRAASTANFLFTLIATFFLFNVIHAFNLAFFWNGFLVAAVSFPLILQTLWSIEMADKLDSEVFFHSLILSLILGELGMVFSFWPLTTVMWSLSLASAMYVILGLLTQHLRSRLTQRIIEEYLLVGVGVLLFCFFTTSWSG